MPGLQAQVIDICRDAGFAPGAVQDDVWLVQTIVGLVAARVGVALVPASAQAVTRRQRHLPPAAREHGARRRARRGVAP